MDWLYVNSLVARVNALEINVSKLIAFAVEKGLFQKGDFCNYEEPLTIPAEEELEKYKEETNKKSDIRLSLPAVSFQTAFKVFCEHLKNDEGLYIAYKANIAMSFYDACKNAGYNLPGLHKLANEAADNFLKLLLAPVPENNFEKHQTELKRKVTCPEEVDKKAFQSNEICDYCSQPNKIGIACQQCKELIQGNNFFGKKVVFTE